VNLESQCRVEQWENGTFLIVGNPGFLGSPTRRFDQGTTPQDLTQKPNIIIGQFEDEFSTEGMLICASDSFSTMALYKSIYLLTYLIQNSVYDTNKWSILDFVSPKELFSVQNAQ